MKRAVTDFYVPNHTDIKLWQKVLCSELRAGFNIENNKIIFYII